MGGDCPRDHIHHFSRKHKQENSFWFLLTHKANRWMTNGHGSKFTRKMEEAVSAMLTQRSVEEAARVAGVGTQTLLRWLKVPAFQTAYREARRSTYSQSVARLQQGSSAAASVLMKVMLDQNSPASTGYEPRNAF